jgi:hypothetical protein
MSAGRQMISGAAMAVAIGVGAGLGVGYSAFSDAEVKSEVEKLNRTCDLVSLRLDTGGALLALFIDADNLNDESVVGKSVLIKNSLQTFSKFTLRMGWAKRGVVADVFYVFSNSEKAFHFRKGIQEQCKYGHLIFPKIYSLPWGIDVSAKSIWAYGGWPPPGYMSGLKKAEIEAKLFS